MMKWYERDLERVEYFTRYLRYITKDMERINTREMETSSELEGTILELLDVQSNMETK